MSEGPSEVKLTPTQLRKLRRKNNKKIRKLKATENSDSSTYLEISRFYFIY